MKKKNGFTLIELLAIFVILGILFFITVPIVKDFYNDSKKEILQGSSENLVKAMNEYYVRTKIKNNFYGCTYDFSNNNSNCDDFSFDGEKPSFGKITLDKEGNINGYVGFDKYFYQIENGKVYNFKFYIDDGTEYVFDYVGNESTLEIEQDGYYRLEVWGAQGGSYSDTYRGGYGAYSTGMVNLHRGQVLYINVGGQGCVGSNNTICGGYNGGGSAITSSSSDFAGGGGGATHIATQSGVLSNLSNNAEDVLIVAGGGGGAYYYPIFNSSGGDAGGDTGSLAPAGTCGDGRTLVFGRNASQLYGGGSNGCGTDPTTLYGSFGQGAFSNSWSSGGGAGYYGGGYGFVHGANGGSSYIGNNLLTDKVMYCYNCLESDDINTKTISTTNVSDSSISEYAKVGNGYAKVTYVGVTK